MGLAHGIGIGIPFKKKSSGSWQTYWATREPSDVTVTITSDTTATVTWVDSIVEGADGYKVYAGAVLKATVAVGAQTANVTGLTADTLYTFKVVAYKGTNESTGITDFARTLYYWWLQGGLTSADVLGAYKAIGVASKTAAKVNINNPGTNDLVETGNLIWTSLVGFSGWSTMKYLTGAVYKSHTYSFIVLVTDVTPTNAAGVAFDCQPDSSGTKGTYCIPAQKAPQTQGAVKQADDTVLFPNKTGGVFGANQNAVCIDGVLIETITQAGVETSRAFCVGTHSVDHVTDWVLVGNVKAIVVYLSSITNSQLITIENAMKATNFITDNMTLRDFTGLVRVSDAIIPHGTEAHNAFGTDTPYINIENKIGDTYYALSQVSETDHTTWGNLALYTSMDLLNWTDHGIVFSAGASGAWDDKYIVHPSVIKIGSTFHLYYSAQNGSIGEIGHATSTDFVNWTKDAANPVYSGNGTAHAYSPCVIKIGSLYYMYYWNGHIDATKALEYATSSDGLTWTFGGVALPAPLATDWDYYAGNGITIDPWVIKNKDGYYEMVYTATNIGVDQKIGYAISRDGKRWYKRQSVLVEGSGDGWDETYVGDPVLLEKPDGTTYLYYGGISGAYPGTATDGGMAIL